MQRFILQGKSISYTRGYNRLFNNLSFQIQNGDCLVINGANGTGKSTLLKIIIGLITPPSGQIVLNRQRMQMSYYHDQLHYIGHNNGLKLGLTVTENFKLFSHLQQHAVSQQAISDALSELNLIEKKDTHVFQLSAGQKRRVVLAKLFLLPRCFWILDEPCTSLDKISQQFFFMKLKEHLQQGGGVIMSSHQPTACATQRLKLGQMHV